MPTKMMTELRALIPRRARRPYDRTVVALQKTGLTFCGGGYAILSRKTTHASHTFAAAANLRIADTMRACCLRRCMLRRSKLTYLPTALFCMHTIVVSCGISNGRGHALRGSKLIYQRSQQVVMFMAREAPARAMRSLSSVVC